MNIRILGTGMTKFGELWKVSFADLAKDALTQAVTASGIEPSQIDALFVGNMLMGILHNQANLGSLLAEDLGVFVPSFHIEGACASGGLALHMAIQSILSNQYETVAVLGVEKMTDHAGEEIIGSLMAAGSEEERHSGITFPGIYALMANAYMQQYHVSEEMLAAVSVKNHYHGSLNPKAQFRSPITIQDVLKSAKVADPIKLLDASPISDGAAAVILTKKTMQKQKKVTIMISEVATDTLSLYKRSTFTSLSAVKRAAESAYKKTGKKPQDIDVAEIHDCFSIAEAIAQEDLGFSKKGMGARDIADGKRTIGTGNIITNSSGGLKACGHPVGATGIKQIVELFEQLTGTAGKRQVKNARVGLAHNVGGSGTVAAIHILQNTS